jgi:hypothetical protein
MAAVARLPVSQSVEETASAPAAPWTPRRVSWVGLGRSERRPPVHRRLRVPTAQAVTRLGAVALLGGEKGIEPGDLGSPNRVDGEPAKGGQRSFFGGIGPPVVKGRCSAVGLLLGHERHPVSEKGPRRVHVVLGDAGVGVKIRFGVRQCCVSACAVVSCYSTIGLVSQLTAAEGLREARVSPPE